MLLRTRGAPERSIAETKVVSTLSNELDDERLGLLGESTSTIHLNNDIAWCNINYEVGKKRILYDCYGHVPSGSLCAIIGASGSGT